VVARPFPSTYSNLETAKTAAGRGGKEKDKGEGTGPAKPPVNLGLPQCHFIKATLRKVQYNTGSGKCWPCEKVEDR